jgi:DNA-binding protein Fis
MGKSNTHPTPFTPPVELQRQRMDMLAQQQQMEQSAQLQPSRVAVAQQTAQQGALNLADQQAMTQAMKQWDGKDINDLPSLVLKANGSANAVLGLKSNIVKYQTDLAKMTADQLTNESTKNDAIAGHIDAIKGLPPEQQAIPPRKWAA